MMDSYARGGKPGQGPSNDDACPQVLPDDYVPAYLSKEVSDRFNLSFQRQLPGKFIADVTYYTNFVSHDQYSLNLNMMDPAFKYENTTLLNTQVANPFRNYLTPDKFPGALRKRSHGGNQQQGRH